MNKVKLSLDKLNPSEKIALARQIVTAMTGNPNFTTPNPTLASITTLANTLSTKVANHDTAKAAQETSLAERDVAEVALAGGLTQIGAYVENIAGGDRVKIESAGMQVRGTNAPVGPLARVDNLALSEGDFDGTLDAMWKPLRGAKSYEVQVSNSPDTGWTPKLTASRSNVTIQGLTSGAKVWVRVRAVGADSTPGPWSDPATKTVP